ncbi:MAG: response regulator [Burkholderiales bacterium]|nr:response regulator [Burkholderiales bacterium]
MDADGLGHELRTPLNAILGFSTLMQRDDNLTDRQRERLATIELAGRRLLGSIDTLLAQRGMAPVDFEPTHSPPATERSRHVQRPAQGALVLVVDDTPDNVALLTDVLQAEGLDVLSAGNGHGAIEIALEHQPDLILMDVQMEGLGGFGACAVLKSEARTRDIPVIFMTVVNDTATKVAAFEAGAADYVTKPFNLDEALARVHTQLRLVHSQKQLARMNSELEERVRERTAQLEAANLDLQSFCHSMAHDLRGPLGALDGFSCLLEEQLGDAENPRTRHYLSRIRAGVKQVDALTEALLSLAHLSLHEGTGEAVDLGELAAHALEAHMAREPQRQVQVDLAQGLEVSADRALLKLLVDHLIANAWKFTAGEALAEIQVGRAADHDGAPVFYVRDNGTGFDMAYADKLFQPFQRLHKVADFPGLGVGLAVVERIVRRHGGRVWVEAEPGRGSTFYFTLSPASADSA